MSNKSGRNELCSCGSGKKFKKCCGFKAQVQRQLKAEVLGKGPFAAAFGSSTKGLSERFFKVIENQEQGQAKQIHAKKGAPDKSIASQGGNVEEEVVVPVSASNE